MSSNTEKAAQYLAENPRTIGALFMATTLLSQAGMVLAANGTGCEGP